MKTFLPVSIVLAMILAAGCSGSQQDDEEFTNENQQGQYQNENSEIENAQGSEYGDSEQASEYGDEAAAVNSDTASDTDEYAEATVPNNTAVNPATNTVDATLDNSGMQAPVANAGNAYSAPVPAAAPAPVAQSASAPIPGGRVRYIKKGGAQIMNGPGGSPVGALSQGDHPVTWEENGWYRITQGMYVSPESVSEKGVGRPKSKGWQ